MHRDSRVRMRALNKKDLASWKILRLEALKNAPEAFASSFEAESQWLDERFKEEPNSLKIDEDFFDEYNMVLQWTKKEAVDAINSQTPKEVTLHYRDFEIAYTVHPLEDSGYYSGDGGIFFHSAGQNALFIPVSPPISCCSEEDFREVYERRAKLAIDAWHLEKEVKALLAEDKSMNAAKKSDKLSHYAASNDEKKYH